MTKLDRHAVHQRREALFARLIHAYLERNFASIEAALRPDVVLHLPGSSPFAGEHQGNEPVVRSLSGLRQFILAKDTPIAYEHHGNLMIASQEILIHGSRHLVEMLVKTTVAFDESDRIAAVHVQPADIGLFDHVIGAALLGSALGP
jgi:hypothetical protein